MFYLQGQMPTPESFLIWCFGNKECGMPISILNKLSFCDVVPGHNLQSFCDNIMFAVTRCNSLLCTWGLVLSLLALGEFHAAVLPGGGNCLPSPVCLGDASPSFLESRAYFILPGARTAIHHRRGHSLDPQAGILLLTTLRLRLSPFSLGPSVMGFADYPHVSQYEPSEKDLYDKYLPEGKLLTAKVLR